MDIIRLENSDYLYGLFIIPLLILISIYLQWKRKRDMAKFGDPLLLQNLHPEFSKYKPFVKFILILISFSFIIFGIANPQIGSKLKEYKREGVDVIIALDVSNSMKCEDIKPNRLDRAKQAISRMIDKLRNDRIGLITFAGTSFMQLPLTVDYSAAKLILSTIDTDVIPVQGTAVGSAIDLAMDSYSDEEKKHKVLIIITDGENHEDDALGKAADAADNGIIIHTIGMGTIKGGPIPVYKNGVRQGYKNNDQGNTIISKLDAAMLQQLAAAGDGEFIRSTGGDPELANLLQDISGMEKKEFSSKMFADYEDRFQYLIAGALLFLLIEFFLSDRKNKLITSLTSFVEKSGRS